MIAGARRGFLRLVGVAACVGCVASCGGGGGPSATAAVTDVVTRGLLTTNPLDCTRLMTHAYQLQNHLGTDATVLAVCMHDLRDPTGNPRSVDVTGVALSGGTAVATVAVHGGDLDGQTLKVRVVSVGGAWKLDRVLAFVGFNRAKFLEGVLEDFTVGPQALPRALGVCFADGLGTLDDAALQQVDLSDDHSTITRLLSGCIASTGVRPPVA